VSVPRIRGGLSDGSLRHPKNYAGGITSSALDGINAALRIAAQ